MRSYLEIVGEQAAPKDCPRAEIALNASIPGQIAPAELECLAQLAHQVPSNGCIVEVGSLFGLSSWTLAKNARANVTVYCIDPWVREPWMAEVEVQAGQTVSLATFEDNTAEISNVIPLPGYSPRDFKGWRRSIDLVFEDSVHSNPVLHENLAFWIQFVVPGGVISGHDYSDAFPDVKSEVDYLANELGQKVTVVGTLWSIRMSENHGLGEA
jgi:predicted O-methyltransferase YrrM